MKQLLLVFTALLVLSAAIPKPLPERELGEIAANGDRNRNGESIDEATEVRLRPLRVDRAPAMATLKCPAGGPPTTRNMRCSTADGSRESLRF